MGLNQDGTYSKTTWYTGDRITAVKLNRIEDTLDGINNKTIDIYNRLDEVDSQLEQKASKTYVSYEEFGAKGDGINNDYEAIKKCHDYANENNFEVRCKSSKYYLSYVEESIIVKTNWNCSNATFIIDDTLENINNDIHVFVIEDESSINISPTSISTPINKKTKFIEELSGYGNCLVEVINSNKKQFIRIGENADNGVYQSDYFRVNNSGNLEDNVLWDFEQITDIKLYPIPNNKLVVSNINIVTKSNNKDSEYNYWKRGIFCTRSNVDFVNVNTFVTDEKSNAQPYDGVITFYKCGNINIDRCNFSPFKWFSNGQVAMGTYCLRLERVVNINIINSKSTEINNECKWGAITSNYCKKVKFNGCEFNRIDGHKGISELIIENSIIGNYGLQVIGHGTLALRNSKVLNSTDLINLRSDYGSLWDGKIIIENVEYTPREGVESNIIRVGNLGNHDFGYLCKYPKLYINNLTINGDNKVYLTMNNNSQLGDGSQYKFDGTDKYAYHFTDLIELRNIKCKKLNLFSKTLVNMHALNKGYIEKGLNTSNTTIIVDNVEFMDKTYEERTQLMNNLFEVVVTPTNFHNTYIILPKIIVKNTTNISLSMGGYPSVLYIDNSKINQLVCDFNSVRRTNANITNTIFEPMLRSVPSFLPQVKFDSSQFNFVNCLFLKPNVYGVEDFSYSALVEIYYFLKEINYTNSFLKFNLNMNNCKMYKDFDFTQITSINQSSTHFGVDINKVFGNTGFDTYPRCKGNTSQRPNISNGVIPCGFSYWDTTTNTFVRWDGGSWQ